MSNSETKLLEPINYTIMHTIYQQFSVLTENSALAPSLLALGLTVDSSDSKEGRDPTFIEMLKEFVDDLGKEADNSVVIKHFFVGLDHSFTKLNL